MIDETKMANAGGSPTDQAAPGDTMIRQKFFKQELNEVYLLLDYVSGNREHKLSFLDKTIKDHNGIELSLNDILEKFSMLYDPRINTTDPDASDAAFLVLLKDQLNSAAFPARGLSVAYTIMFAESGNPSASYWWPPPDTPPEIESDIRAQAAVRAFPSLRQSAHRFMALRKIFVIIEILVTLLAAVMLWNVTYGAQISSRFEEAKKNETSSAEKLYNQIEREYSNLNAGQRRISEYIQRNPSSDNTTNADKKDVQHFPSLIDFCKISLPAYGDKETGNNKSSSDDRSFTTRMMCDDYAYKHALLCEAVSDVSKYGRSIIFKFFKSWLLPMHHLQKYIDCTTNNYRGNQEDAQSVANALAMLSNYFLPILFGFVGSLAALLRGIQEKVRDSILSPRDASLALMRIPLGIVAGVIVGLFLNPLSYAAQISGNLGAFTLSASGVAFLAGYGAEAVFQALDALTVRVFNLEVKNEPVK